MSTKIYVLDAEVRLNQCTNKCAVLFSHYKKRRTNYKNINHQKIMLILLITLSKAMPSDETLADLSGLKTNNEKLSEFIKLISQVTIADTKEIKELDLNDKILRDYNACMNSSKDYEEKLNSLRKSLDDNKSKNGAKPVLKEIDFFNYDTEAFFKKLVGLFSFFSERPDLTDKFSELFTDSLRVLRHNSSPVEGDTKTTTNTILRFFGFGKNERIETDEDHKQFRTELRRFVDHYKQILDHLSKILYSDGMIKEMQVENKDLNKISQDFMKELETFKSHKQQHLQTGNPK
ncbi:hypothetical protein THOM_0168 [Trachipleistophora hominis]|uniref:Uncharacterized protein n=1 Tax=Trachipleistophora hominis TaxID=72359 RepID=L7JZI3_TRAHO|nr:hypothetical protein THOM_0168 [Trachipleistophora hominis]